MLLIYLLFVMVDTALWYRSAKRAVEAGGRCPQGNYRLRKMMACWMMVCSAAAALFTLWWVLKQENRWIILPSMGVILLSMGLGFLLRKKLKRTGISAKRNLILVMIFQLLVMFAAISALVWWGISAIEARQEAGSIPYTVTNNDRTMTFTLYRDQLPLTLEDLGYEVDKDIYSYRLDQSSSPVFSKLEGDQDSYASLAGEETWDLSYTAVPFSLVRSAGPPDRRMAGNEMTSLNGSSPEPQSGRIWRPCGAPKELGPMGEGR